MFATPVSFANPTLFGSPIEGVFSNLGTVSRTKLLNHKGESVPATIHQRASDTSTKTILLLNAGSTLTFEYDGAVDILTAANVTNFSKGIFEWTNVDDAQDSLIVLAIPVLDNPGAGDSQTRVKFKYSYDYAVVVDDGSSADTVGVDLPDYAVLDGVVLEAINGANAHGVCVRRRSAQDQMSFAKSTTNITQGQTATITITPRVSDPTRDRIVRLTKTLDSVRYSLSDTEVVIPKGSVAAQTVTITTTAGAALANTNVSYSVDNGRGGQTGTLTFAIVT